MIRYPLVLVITIFPTILIRAIKRDNIQNENETDFWNAAGMIGISLFGALAVFSYVFICDFCTLLKKYIKTNEYKEELERELSMDTFVSV